MKNCPTMKESICISIPPVFKEASTTEIEVTGSVTHDVGREGMQENLYKIILGHCKDFLFYS